MDQLVKDVIGRTDDDMGKGSEFIILVGATSAHSFFNPYIPEVIWPDGFEDMLGLQLERRSAILTEVHRLSGPDGENAPIGGPPGPYIQMGSFRMSTLEKASRSANGIPNTGSPIWRKCRDASRPAKYVGVAGWAKHAVLYEFTSAAARLQQFEIEHETHDLDSDAWHTKVLPFTSRSPCERYLNCDSYWR